MHNGDNIQQHSTKNEAIDKELLRKVREALNGEKELSIVKNDPDIISALRDLSQLGLTTQRKAVSALLFYSLSSRCYRRLKTIWAIGAILGPTSDPEAQTYAINQLCPYLEDSYYHLREEVAYALIGLGPISDPDLQQTVVVMIIDALLPCSYWNNSSMLYTNTCILRALASVSLESQGAVIDSLIAHLKDRDQYSRHGSAYVLRELGFEYSHEVWQAITEALGIPNLTPIVAGKAKEKGDQISNQETNQRVKDFGSARRPIEQVVNTSTDPGVGDTKGESASSAVNIHSIPEPIAQLSERVSVLEHMQLETQEELETLQELKAALAEVQNLKAAMLNSQEEAEPKSEQESDTREDLSYNNISSQTIPSYQASVDLEEKTRELAAKVARLEERAREREEIKEQENNLSSHEKAYYYSFVSSLRAYYRASEILDTGWVEQRVDTSPNQVANAAVALGNVAPTIIKAPITAVRAVVRAREQHKRNKMVEALLNLGIGGVNSDEEINIVICQAGITLANAPIALMRPEERATFMQRVRDAALPRVEAIANIVAAENKDDSIISASEAVAEDTASVYLDREEDAHEEETIYISLAKEAADTIIADLPKVSLPSTADAKTKAARIALFGLGILTTVQNIFNRADEIYSLNNGGKPDHQRLSPLGKFKPDDKAHLINLLLDYCMKDPHRTISHITTLDGKKALEDTIAHAITRVPILQSILRKQRVPSDIKLLKTKDIETLITSWQEREEARASNAGTPPSLAP